MTGSKRFKAIILAGALVALTAVPALADARLQGVWLMDGPDHVGIVFSGPNFVMIDGFEGLHMVGNFTVSGNVMTLNITHVHDVFDDLWIPIRETERLPFSFRANNILVIDGDVFRRS